MKYTTRSEVWIHNVKFIFLVYSFFLVFLSIPLLLRSSFAKIFFFARKRQKSALFYDIFQSIPNISKHLFYVFIS